MIQEPNENPDLDEVEIDDTPIEEAREFVNKDVKVSIAGVSSFAKFYI